MDGWSKLGTPVIWVAHFDPLVHEVFEPNMDTVIDTFGSTDETFPAIMAVLTGQRDCPRGDVP